LTNINFRNLNLMFLPYIREHVSHDDLQIKYSHHLQHYSTVRASASLKMFLHVSLPLANIHHPLSPSFLRSSHTPSHPSILTLIILSFSVFCLFRFTFYSPSGQFIFIYSFYLSSSSYPRDFIE
jgi:hypothetical protein